MHPCARQGFRDVLIELAMLTFAVGGSMGAPVDAGAEKKMDAIRTRAEQGYVQQQIELAAAYLAGRGVPQDPAQAAHWYLKAAENGNPEAQNQIGYFYQYGVGVPMDAVQAARWFQLASASGFARAKVNLGVSYLRGDGVRPNASTARQLFVEAVDKGSGLGATYLGVMDFFGFGAQVDKASAEHWFEVGVKLHDPEAAFDLAVLYCESDGTKHDLHRASELLRFSASRGYVAGMHSLGQLLLNHPELAQSPQEARFALEEASRAGSWKSSVLLGVLERDGSNGSSVDAARSYYYFQLAVLQGGRDAEHLISPDITALKRKLSSEQQGALVAQAAASFQEHSAPMVFVPKDEDAKNAFPLVTATNIGPLP